MNAKITFGKLPFVAARVAAEGGSMHERDNIRTFEREWKADPTVEVRRFKRSVRAGGTSLEAVMVVVRRKPVQG